MGKGVNTEIGTVIVPMLKILKKILQNFIQKRSGFLYYFFGYNL